MFSVMLLLAQVAPVSDSPATPPAEKNETQTTKKVCQTIEIPMSRMPKRVCQTVVVKKTEPSAPAKTEPTTQSGE